MEWNRSVEMERMIPSLQSHHYLVKKKSLLMQAEKALDYLKNTSKSSLTPICNPEREGYLLGTDIGIYKKDREVLKEALVWELSLLLGCDSFIAPSLPISIEGSLATFQPYFELEGGFSRFIKKGTPSHLKIEQDDFWIMALFTFLIGHSDLNGTNIMYTKNHLPILCDNDCSFPESNQLSCSEGNRLNVPLTNGWIDLEEAYKPLSEAACEQVWQFQHNLFQVKDDIEKFITLTPLSTSLNEKSIISFWERFHRITSTPVKAGMSLCEYSYTLFSLYYAYVEELIFLLSQVVGCELGPATSLYFIGPYFPWAPIQNERDTTRIKAWIAKQCTSQVSSFHSP